jgi:hypothetical protein
LPGCSGAGPSSWRRSSAASFNPAAASSPTTGFWSHRFFGDSDVYGFYAEKIRAGQAPYRDFLIEYPPGSLLAFVPPRLSLEALQHAGLSELDYTDLFKTAMLICGFSSSVALRAQRTSSGTIPGVRSLLPRSSGQPARSRPNLLSWYDVWPTLLTLGAVAVFLRRHFTAAFVLLGAAVATKLFALILLPLLFCKQLARWAGNARSSL